jgi:hypothetical protein
MAIQLVPAAKKWHNRWSTWLLGSAGLLSSLQAFVPGIQQYMPATAYNITMIGLAVLTFAAAQVKQFDESGVGQ